MKTGDMFRLDGRVAIVTGGSVGLGQQMATALAEMGANVVVAARKVERCEEMARQLRELGVKAMAIRCDVGETEDCTNLISRTIQEFGTIDILVNNAGMTWGAPAINHPLEKLERVMKVNLIGSLLLAQGAARVMIDQKKRGKIINIASVSALKGSRPEAQDAIGYSASKGAIVSMTRDLAVKWARYDINVNAIAPGWFLTHMTEGVLSAGKAEEYTAAIPLNRFGSDSDLKGMIVYLASDASNYMTGQVLSVDGGITA